MTAMKDSIKLLLLLLPLVHPQQDSCVEMPGCISCSNPALHCSRCQSGWALRQDARSCQNCRIDNCEQCRENPAGTLVCNTCKKGWVSTVGGTCVACELENCETCKLVDPQLSSSSARRCLKCSSPQTENATFYFVNKQGQCQACPRDCELCDGPATCLRCAAGFVESTSGQCLVCPSSCAYCSGVAVASSASESQCRRCNRGFFLDNTSKRCLACNFNCEICNSVSSCIQCKPHFHMPDQTRNFCEECPAHCLTCSVSSEGAMLCHSCEKGFAIDKQAQLQECLECPSNCDRCFLGKASPTCTVCKQGHALTSDKSNCLACSSLSHQNCELCLNAESSAKAKCTKCRPGFTLADDQSSCLECSSLSGCEDCLDVGWQCSDCQLPYRLDSTMAQCKIQCHQCEAKSNISSPDSCIPTRNSLVECNNACVTTLITNENETRYFRGCANYECGDHVNEEFCQSANGRTECSLCCVDNFCNSGLLTDKVDLQNSAPSSLPNDFMPTFGSLILTLLMVSFTSDSK